MKLNIRQRKVVESDETNILCLAPAGSGKTAVLTERIRYLIQNKHVAPTDIVAISFTNMAADEMKKRLGSIANCAFIGTIHSYANQICTNNGIDTTHYIKEADFDNILKKALTISVDKYPKAKYLLVDEAQDLGKLDYTFLNKLPCTNHFYVGDDRQAIYGFRGCSDEYMRDMDKDNSYKKFYLVDSYRSAPNILKFASHLLYSYDSLSPNTIPYKTKEGLLEECSLDDALSDLEDSGNWGSWFILTRTNNELASVQEMLDEREIPNVTFKKGDLDLIQLDELMSSNRVKVLTVHSSKGLENKNVIVTGARLYNLEERKIAYVAATRAENALYWCPSFMKRSRKKW
jgi:DNA helicase-2/ATP-dependent DNA helicase PcrA